MVHEYINGGMEKDVPKLFQIKFEINIYPLTQGQHHTPLCYTNVHNQTCGLLTSSLKTGYTIHLIQ